MDRDEILAKVKEITAEELGVDADSLDEDTNFKALGADSFDLLQLVTAFEEAFSATIDDEVLQSTETIADAVSAIESAGV